MGGAGLVSDRSARPRGDIHLLHVHATAEEVRGHQNALLEGLPKKPRPREKRGRRFGAKKTWPSLGGIKS